MVSPSILKGEIPHTTRNRGRRRTTRITSISRFACVADGRRVWRVNLYLVLRLNSSILILSGRSDFYIRRRRFWFWQSDCVCMDWRQRLRYWFRSQPCRLWRYRRRWAFRRCRRYWYRGVIRWTGHGCIKPAPVVTSAIIYGDVVVETEIASQGLCHRRRSGFKWCRTKTDGLILVWEDGNTLDQVQCICQKLLSMIGHSWVSFKPRQPV